MGLETFTDQEVEKETTFTELQTGEGNVPLVELDENVYLEPVAPEAYDLSYACLMIPRFPTHLLKGDITIHLPQWLQTVCVSCSWRLGFTNVREEYLQWGIRVPPSDSPGKFMHIIRHETSKQIFDHFPRYKKVNVMTDFWAQGYLLILGMRPHPAPMVEQFIQITRRQQCLSR